MTDDESLWEALPVSDDIQAIIEFSNLEYHVYNCHPEWVEAWRWLIDHKTNKRP
jgi:hypothetical protein